MRKESYLNGKVTVTSLAAPTDEDMSTILALSLEERRAMLAEKRERGRKAPITTRTREQIKEAAKKRAAAVINKPEYAVQS